MKYSAVITGNPTLRIVSVVMAVLLWIYVMAGKDSEMKIKVPVLFTNLHDSLTVVDKPPVTLDVVLKGDWLSLMMLSKESMKLVVDMQGVGEGTVSYSNLETALVSDSRVHVTRVQPARIEITLARIDTKQQKRK